MLKIHLFGIFSIKMPLLIMKTLANVLLLLIDHINYWYLIKNSHFFLDTNV